MNMHPDFIDDLLQALERIISPDRASLKEVLIISGMPEATQNLRYLGFNRQVVCQGHQRIAFSAVAVVNNRRTAHWQLKGYFQKVSQVVFNPRWTRNELDLFINALRCSPEVLSMIATSPAPYSLLGILEIEDRNDSGIFRRWRRRVRPVLIVPGLEAKDQQTIAEFERLNEIRKSGKRSQPC